MNKYYERPQKEIIGFYCFISDKPQDEIVRNKGSRSSILEIAAYLQSLMTPTGKRPETSYPGFV